MQASMLQNHLPFKKFARCSSSFGLVLPALLMSACASHSYLATNAESAGFLARRVNQSAGPLRVSVAVPNAAETETLTGLPLYEQGVQPVWVQIENRSDTLLMFTPAGLDRAYYTALETASRHYSPEQIIDGSAVEEFRERSIQILIEPGETRSGYVFTRVDEGTKSFNVDVFAAGEGSWQMSLFVPAPGLRIDHYGIDFAHLYSDSELTDVDLDGLMAGLEALPCCVRDKKDRTNGDPLNIAFVGNAEDFHYTLLRAGRDETETVYGAALIKMGISAMFGSEYRYSPVCAPSCGYRPHQPASAESS